MFDQSRLYSNNGQTLTFKQTDKLSLAENIKVVITIAVKVSINIWTDCNPVACETDSFDD